MVAVTRGSIKAICRAAEPAATRLTAESAASERSAWDVVRVSTEAPDVKSQVRSVWSQEVEYPTVGSCGANIVAETGAE